MPPTGGPAGVPGCCGCSTPGLVCNGFTVPRVNLELSFTYRTLSYGRPTPFSSYTVSCGSRTITVPLIYTPGTPEKWLSANTFINDFPTYQRTDNQTGLLADSGCSRDGTYKWELLCNVGVGPRLDFHARVSTSGAFVLVNSAPLINGTYDDSPLYMDMSVGVTACPSGGVEPNRCTSAVVSGVAVGYPWLISSTVTEP
jgi:hypothetical protein